MTVARNIKYNDAGATGLARKHDNALQGNKQPVKQLKEQAITDNESDTSSSPSPSPIKKIQPQKRNQKIAKVEMPAAPKNLDEANKLPVESAQGQPKNDDVDVLVSQFTHSISFL